MTVMVCFIALFLATPPQGTAKADPREQLGTTIAEGIRLLEAKDYKAFVAAFFEPEALKKRPEGVDALVERVSSRATLLLAALKEAQRGTPVMEADGTKATYALEAPGGGPKSLRFEKIGKLWYIAN